MLGQRVSLLMIVTLFLSVNAMETVNRARSGMALLLDTNIAHNSIQPLLSYQEIGRLKRASQWCNALYDGEHHSCSTYSCGVLANNYYACSKALAHFSENNDEMAKPFVVNREEIFKHLWRCVVTADYIHEAVRNRDVCRILKKSMHFTTVQEQMAVYRAYYCKNKNILTTMVKFGIKALKKEDRLMAQTLFKYGRCTIIDLVEDYHATKDILSKYVNIADVFYRACRCENIALIEILCAGRITDQLLPYVMTYADSYVIRVLIHRDILPVNCVDQWGKSPLHYAAMRGFTSVIKLLLERDAYVNCTDGYLMTPLHYAVRHGQFGAAEALLTHNDADVRFTDIYKKSPLDYVLSLKVFALDIPEEAFDRKAIKALLVSHVKKNIYYDKDCGKHHGGRYYRLQ